ncbi:MAG: cadmium-translocating P-type ATPase [Alphaproteobacteria bacterium]|nr:MAG: cadmium-translocating P-type ATPase [Alphaproteobacteria bacterium]
MALAHPVDIQGEGAKAPIHELDLIVNGMHCAGCMRKIERGLGELEGVSKARCNLSTRRVHVEWESKTLTDRDILTKMKDIGFEATPFDPKLLATADENQARRLLRAMAVAGFAAANVMLFSVSVWSGQASDMDPETLHLFHWLSALIAIPAVAYAGQPFFASAVRALKGRSLNMDVPISLAVLLATGMSLFETIRGGHDVYFDASVSLLFFLLIGRYLDIRMRNRACSAAQNLMSLRAVTAQRILADGSYETVGVCDLLPGDLVAVPAGGRMPADGEVVKGISHMDASLVTGESLPERVVPGTLVFAGTINQEAPLEVRVTKSDEDSLLAEIVRLMEAAEQGRAGYVQMADRIARIYAPAVHILAAGTFLGWLAFGATVHGALMSAIAVLIITCPCALGLAVPVVQVVASGKLLRLGVLVKSADGLERLADIDQVVFDKTGTITTGDLKLRAATGLSEEERALARSLALKSSHPLSKVVAESFKDCQALPLESLVEMPGMGLSGRYQGEEVRMGNAEWVGGVEGHGADTSGLWIRKGSNTPKWIAVTDTIKEDAAAVLDYLAHDYRTHLLSGDREAVVAAQALHLKFDEVHAQQRPNDKIAYLERLKKEGAKVLMVGDGLNDAPALRAAHVSMSPAEAADISQTAADFIFQGKNLGPVVKAIRTATFARRLILENFGFAFLYNAVAIPLAIAGFVTPLFAAIAMSSSSLIVTANAMRLNWERRK